MKFVSALALAAATASAQWSHYDSPHVPEPRNWEPERSSYQPRGHYGPTHEPHFPQAPEPRHAPRGYHGPQHIPQEPIHQHDSHFGSYQPIKDPFEVLHDRIDALEEDLQGQIDDITCGLPVLDFFDTNDSDITILGMTNPGTPQVLYGPFCVSAGMSVDLMLQISPEAKVEDVCLGIYKDSVLVAQGCSDDNQEPSSLSVFYRETLGDDAQFSVEIRSRLEDTVPPKNLQFGARVYGQCYSITNELPDAECPEPEGTDEPVYEPEQQDPHPYPHPYPQPYPYHPHQDWAPQEPQHQPQPNWEQPQHPKHPHQPNWEQAQWEQPQWEQPQKPNWEQAQWEQPQWEQSAQPNWEQAQWEQPQWEQPAQPNWEQAQWEQPQWEHKVPSWGAWNQPQGEQQNQEAQNDWGINMPSQWW